MCLSDAVLTYAGFPIRVQNKFDMAATSGSMICVITNVLTTTISIVTCHYNTLNTNKQLYLSAQHKYSLQKHIISIEYYKLVQLKTV